MSHHMHHNTAAGPATALAFLAGVAAGIAAGMLFAPREGRETRNRIKAKAQEARRQAMDKMEAEKTRAKERIHHATEHIGEAGERIGDESQAAAHDIQERVRKAGRNATREM